MIAVAPALLGVHGTTGRRLVAGGALHPLVTATRGQSSSRTTALAADEATWSEFAANVPRFTGSATRLLIEGQRSNRIRNPRGENAVAGTPGTMPTNWSIDGLPSGIDASILGVFTVAGVQCLRLRLSGTPVATANARLECEGPAIIGASNGQGWTASVFVRLHAGSQANLGLALRVMGRDGALTDDDLVSSAIPLTAALERQTVSIKLSSPNVATASSDIELAFTLDQPVDCTLDLGWPQMEQASFASSPILPIAGSTGISTRGADLLTVSLASLGIGANGACTVLVWAMLPQAAASLDQMLAQVDDGTNNNRYRMFNVAGGTAVNVGRSLGGSGLTSTAGTIIPGTPFRLGMSIDGAGRVAGSFDGGTIVTRTGGPTEGLTTLRIGNNAGNSSPLCGQIAEFRVLPYSVADAALPGIVAALPG
jgi:hypothetical protein